MSNFNDFIQSSWVSAIFALLMNFGSGYIARDVQKIFKNLFDYKLMKWLIFFTLCFTTTRNVYISLCISLVLVLFLWYFLNEESNFCILNDSKFCRFFKILKRKIKSNVQNSIENF